ncbi:MAG TPA: hypothetical protein VGF39_09560 [Stellaceae bacterium]|jgi:hypothetical protein
MFATMKAQSPPPDSERERLYDFDKLRHGDTVPVRSKLSAQEMFRRWRRRTGRKARLVGSRDTPDVLYFIDEEV